MAKVNENGIVRELTAEELQQMNSGMPVPTYDELVDAEIRKRYSASQEFAILRQKDEKPVEYAEYYAYCEECKSKIKAVM